VHELKSAAQRALHRNPLDPGDVDRLVDAVELLPDWYDDWVLHEREQLTQLRLLALEAACEQFVAAGRFRDATTAALAAVASDPLSESSRSVLISAYLGAGHHVDAARQLADYRHRLKDELGLEPSVRIVELLDVGSRDGSQEPSTVTRG
jgi:DNA-binding SARP family transcriptional activator